MKNSIFIAIIFSSLIFPQSKNSVRGKVISFEEKSPIIGASVFVPNTSIGTSTGIDGKFIITNLPSANATLIISAIGFKPINVAVESDSAIEMVIELSSSPVQTQTVVVTANKRQQTLEEVPVSMSIIDAKLISSRTAISVDDALRYIPGVNFNQTQMNIRASSGYSRGVGSRVLMLVDGMPLLAGDTGEITFESIPIFQIDRVEVLKGAGSALYGSGALGGVINVLTKEISEEPLFRWKTYSGMYSSPKFDEWKWSDKTRFTNGEYIGFEQKFDNIGISTSLHRTFDDGYRENDWLRRYSGFLKIKYDFSPTQAFTFTTTGFLQQRGDFLWWKNLTNALRPADGQRNASVTSLRWNNTAHYTLYVNENIFGDVKVVHFHSNWHRDSLNLKRMDESSSDAFTVDAQGNLIVNKQNILTVGIVGNREEVQSMTFGTHVSNGFALYLQDEFTFMQNFSATAGVRYDVQQVKGLSQNEQINPKFGMRYSPYEGSTLRASVGRGFRAPSIGELYVSTSNTGSSIVVVPSTYLKPEHSWSYEIGGTQLISGESMVDIAFFQSDLSDLIEPSVELDQTLNAAVVRFRNITQARIQGFETGYHSQWFDRALSFEVNYNYNWAVNRETGSFLKYRPRHIAMTNISYEQAMFNGGIDFRFISRVEEIDDNLIKLAPINNGEQRVPIYIVDVRIAANLTEIGYPINASLNIHNLLHYNYVELIGNIAPPRQFVVTLEGSL
ncbi:MAG: TonB-dependent receptor [Bacteroidota bacterium]|nr:TonB-dependent receptor [Bacteroidota bacterium]